MESEPVAMGQGRYGEGYAASPQARQDPQGQDPQGSDLARKIEVGGKVYQDDGFGVGRCMVRFQCPVCRGEAILNAYRGQPFHHGRCDGAAMKPVSLVLPENSQDPRGSPHRA